MTRPAPAPRDHAIKQAFTLVELLVTLAMTTVIIGTLGTAYFATLQYTSTAPARLDAFAATLQTDETLRKLIAAAHLSTADDDPLTYFVCESADPSVLTFTTTGQHPEGAFLRATRQTFEELHETFGPQGGVTEISLSLTPVGDPGGRAGLFLRTQTPSDGDITQGGTERLLVPDAETLAFEFWDGQEWLPSWDTREIGRRLPAAVRIRYTLAGETDERTLTIRVQTSDVTPDNPLTQTIGGGA